MRNLLGFLSLLLLIQLSLPAHAEEEEADAVKAPPAYFHLKPSIVSNLNGGPRYLRAEVQILATDAEVIPDLETHAPALRHEFLMLLTEQDGKALKTPEGKEQLRKAAIAAFQKVMQEMTGKEAVKDLFFTAFYVR